MARFGRRRPTAGIDAGVDADDEEWPGEEPPGRRRLGRAAPTPVPEDDLPSSRLRGNEIPYGYAVGGIIAVAGVVMLLVTTGKGAPIHPQPLWPALAVVFGVATVLSIRFSNRMLTSLVAIAGGFVSGQAKTPNSLAGIKIVALLAPVVYGMLIFRRQSKADRLARTQRARGDGRSGAPARGRRGRGAAKDEPAPKGPKATGRYTPPKTKGVTRKR